MQGTRNWQHHTAVAAVLALGALVAACESQSEKPTSLALNGSKSPGPSETAKPSAVPVSSSNPTAEYIVIKHGQTLYQIARAHHVPMITVADANTLKPPYLLRTGSWLVIPHPGPPPLNLASAAPVSSPDQSATTTTQVSSAPTPRETPYVVAFYDAPRNGAVQPLQVQTLVGPDLPEAPSVLPPRNPAAALPLPGENP